MRVVCAVLASMVAVSVASAHPVMRDDDLFDLDRPLDRPRARRPPPRTPTPEETCERNKSWSKLVACLKKGGNTVTTMTDLGSARLVSVKASPTYDSASVYIYALRGGRWQRLNGYFVSNPTTEVLSFTRFKTGYRLEQGQVYKTSAFVGERVVGIEPARVLVTVRRKTTSVCLDNNYCQTLVTSCDGLVDGKARWSFRGSPVLDHGQLRLVGDRTFAGSVCAVSPSQMTNDGDPLE